MYEYFCNKCFHRNRLEPTVQFYISTCEHVFCKSCVNKICPVCGRPYKPTMVCKGMPMNMATYFGDALKLFRGFQRVIKFQTEQDALRFKHLYEALPVLFKKVNKEQSALLRVEEQIRTSVDAESQRITKLRKYLANYKRRFEQVPVAISLTRSQPSRGECRGRAAGNFLSGPTSYHRSVGGSPWGRVSTPTLSLPDSCDD